MLLEEALERLVGEGRIKKERREISRMDLKWNLEELNLNQNQETEKSSFVLVEYMLISLTSVYFRKQWTHT
jgi:hypothetical protein